MPRLLYVCLCRGVPQAFECALRQGLVWRHDVDWAVHNTGLRRLDDGSPQLVFMSRRTWASGSISSVAGAAGFNRDPVTAPWVASNKVCTGCAGKEGKGGVLQQDSQGSCYSGPSAARNKACAGDPEGVGEAGAAGWGTIGTLVTAPGVASNKLAPCRGRRTVLGAQQASDMFDFLGENIDRGVGGGAAGVEARGSAKLSVRLMRACVGTCTKGTATLVICWGVTDGLLSPKFCAVSLICLACSWRMQLVCTTG